MTHQAVISLLALAGGVSILIAAWIVNYWIKTKYRRKRWRKRGRPRQG